MPLFDHFFTHCRDVSDFSFQQQYFLVDGVLLLNELFHTSEIAALFVRGKLTLNFLQPGVSVFDQTLQSLFVVSFFQIV